MLCVLILTLTSYDIHPIGCLSNISISYNETEASVTLIISENSIYYKKNMYSFDYRISCHFDYLEGSSIFFTASI